jgi:nucleoside-diphosphate-sugar epimerase
MKYLLTGGCGFVGSNRTARLVAPLLLSPNEH